MADFSTLLGKIYGQAHGEQIASSHIELLINRYRGRIPVPQRTSLTQQDSILITYADQVQQPGQAHLDTLSQFSSGWLNGVVSSIHILPFYPWTSDDGFSVVDYRAVDPAYGGWEDLQTLGQDFRLMFDAVINHVSVSSEWFRGFLKDDPQYAEYFVTFDTSPDLSQVVRPRTHPVLTSFDTINGPKKVWTTFSTDQVDLNYANPQVLLEILDVLLGYAARGAEFIRLDAIAFMWKVPGSTSIHLPQTHAIIQLIRAVFEAAAPHVRLITETNVPHQDNISYFGDGTNEAHMVYNFALPPLVLHALSTHDASYLTGWAAGLRLPSKTTTFFNFLASHDGIGLNPARGILPATDIDAMVARVQKHNGLVSYKTNPDGSQSPYELNINYFDALNNPAGNDEITTQIDRFIAAHAILLALQGVPGIYFHSLMGSRGWPEGVEQTGRNRTINRQKLTLAGLETGLNTPGSLRQRVFRRMKHLLVVRSAHPAFDPHQGQTVLSLHPGVFALLRQSADNHDRVLCLHNLTPDSITIDRPDSIETALDDLIDNTHIPANQTSLPLQPYQVRWLNLTST